MDFEKIYSQNMKFLKKTHKALYDEIEKADISNVSLEINNLGEVNVGINGELLYPKNNINTSILKQVQNYINNPTAYVNLPPITEGKDPFAKIHEGYQLQIQEISPYLQKQKKYLGYKHQTDSLYTMLMFGVGNAQHILYLISQIDIKNLIIIDKDFSLIKLSMHVTDWTPIYRYFSRPNYSLNFKIGTDKREALSATLINHLFLENPYLCYYLPYYLHYDCEEFQILHKNFLKHSAAIQTGLGFYDDERTSILHTLTNLKAKRPILQKNKTLSRKNNYSVFIIGSGPSIDNDIEYIKKHQDNVLIISGGSSLKVLESNGITPDFHFEMERNIVTKEELERNFSKEYLKSLNIIGLNLIHPETYDLFKSSYIFCRDNDAGASILGENYIQLDHCNPTVINAMFSFCSHIGFKNIYLFGADMGYISEDSHHSKHSGYYKNDEVLSKWRPTTLKRPIDANFGDKKIYTTNDFLWNKRRLRNAIIDYIDKQKLDINYFNCSDGALLDGAKPIHSKDIIIDTIDKEKMLIELHDCFVFNKSVSKDVQKGYNIQKKKLYDTINKLESIINKDIKNYSELFDIIIESKKLVVNSIVNRKNSSMTFSLLRGTYDTFLAKIYTHSLAYQDSKEGLVFAKEAFKIVSEFLDRVKNEIQEFENKYII